MTPRSLGHRAPLLWALLPLMIGLSFGKLEWLPASPVVSAWLGASAAVFGGLALGFRRAWAPCLVVSLVLSGGALYGIKRHRLAEWESLPPREARLTIRVDRLFAPHADGKTAGGLGHVVAADSPLGELAGQPVYFSISLKSGKATVAPPISTTVFTATGLLQTIPLHAEASTFDGYLADQGINFRFTRARIAEVDAPPTAYGRFRDKTLKRFMDLLGRGGESHPRLVAIFRAMLLGQRQDLSEDQHQVFLESGTLHMFSISGLHIAAIAAVIFGALALLRLPGWALLIAGGGALWFYVDVTGASPSAVRAWIMVMFLLSSRTLRAPGNPFAALVASAFVVLLLQPMQFFSASFQLSYGLVAALLVMGLPLGEASTSRWPLFPRLPKSAWTRRHRLLEKLWRGFLEAFALGVACEIPGALLGVVIFHQFTPGALVANLVIIPVGMLVVLAGFLALLCGLAGLGALTVIFNHAALLILAAIEWTVRVFVTIPGTHYPAKFAPEWFGFAAASVVLAAMLYGYSRKWELRRGGFWLPPALVVLALVLGAQFG